MDEPTNFLDLESVDSLIQACNKYKGALLLVSHNRDFLKKCAKQYLSIVPGRFELYDTLKVAEKATYTFIDEMESGTKINSKDVIQNNPGGGSIHSSQKVNAEGSKEEAKPETQAAPSAKETTATTTETQAPTPTPATTQAPAPTPAAKKEEPAITYALKERVQALWTDGKWYTAEVKSFDKQNGKYTVYYVEYGNAATQSASTLRKFVDNKAAQSKAQQMNTNQKTWIQSHSKPNDFPFICGIHVDDTSSVSTTQDMSNLVSCESI